MRSMLMSAALLLIGCNEASNPPPAAKQAAPSAEQSVLAANAAKDRAMIARDAAALDRFYTDDYRLIDDDAGLHDKPDQIRFMTQQVELLSAVSDEVRVSMLGPDSALVTGRLTGRYRMNGQESDYVERYTGVWVRQGDAWRVRHEHGSLVPAAD